MPRPFRRSLTPLLAAGLLTLPACGPTAEPSLEASEAADGRTVSPEHAAAVETMREVAARYADVEVALADGYLRDPMDMCITAPMEGMPAQLGAMGIHFFRPDILGITGVQPRVAGTGTHTDFAQPGVLIYEPQADGSLELVAIENLVWAGAWAEAGNTAAPSYLGHEFYRMIDNPLTPDVDEAHGFEPHFELHAWVPRENPSGMFAPFNAAVTCEHHAPAHAADH